MIDGGQLSNDWRPTARLDRLRRRAELLRETRAFFTERGFLEIETPVLSRETIVDRHLDPLSVRCDMETGDASDSARGWLQTSPELGMKRALAAYGVSLFQVTRAFRAGEVGVRHNPEFTMVEWYEVGAGIDAGIERLSQYAERLLGRPPARRVSYADAFQAHAGINPHRATIEAMAEAGSRLGKTVPESLPRDPDAWRNWLLAECVEPHLGWGEPAIVWGYPASQAALARLHPDDPAVAERFELYVDGVELANGYHELLDANELAARARSQNRAREAGGKTGLPAPNRLLNAMRAGMPSCAGVALGFDRLVMIATGSTDIREVMAFPWDRA
ncbi:MAG: EF-P lysine aminoacylase GenX [Planctomycetes bacterium]|nr:EF-P lysine aminoacylase GenX [Planctomycetota bacterium]